MNAKFRAGEHTCAYAPIGYKKNPDIKNKLMIDEETRWIVKKIFELALLGNGASKIMKLLIADRVPTPSYLNYKRFGTFSNIYADAPEEKAWEWNIGQVKSILKDETYIGNSVHYRQTKASFKSKRRVYRDRSEWLTVEGTHEPIISKSDFDNVQGQLASRRREKKDFTTQVFAGLLKCSGCGWALTYDGKMEHTATINAANTVCTEKDTAATTIYIMTHSMHMSCQDCSTGQSRLIRTKKNC